MKCEAREMAIQHFDDYEIPSCDEEGTVEVVGFTLCAGCEDALKRIVDLSNIVVKKRNEEN